MKYAEQLLKVTQLKPRETYVYYTGFIGDCQAGVSELTLANEVYRLYEEEKIHLYQRKISNGNWDYIAEGIR